MMSFFSRPQRSGRHSTFVALALAVAFVLSGCGGGSVQVEQLGATAGTGLPQAAAIGEGRETAKALQAMDIPTGFTGNGWYWNPNEGGTGFFIEAQGKSAYLGVYVYDDFGHPT